MYYGMYKYGQDNLQTNNKTMKSGCMAKSTTKRNVSASFIIVYTFFFHFNIYTGKIYYYIFLIVMAGAKRFNETKKTKSKSFDETKKSK